MGHSIALTINSLGWTLLHSLWQGAMIGLLFIVSRSVLASASPAIRHANALTWLMLFMALPIVTFVALLTMAVGSPQPGATAPILQTISVVPWPSEPAGLFPHALAFIGCLWLSGVIVLSIRLAGEWRELQNTTRIGSRALPQLARRFGKLKDAMNVRISVRLIEAANATVPMVVGILRPAIVLPGSVILGLTPRELELIIAHELAHLRRQDHLINYVLILGETLFFYHPVVYALTRTIRHERELCCDDLVIGTFNERVCYAHALSKVETLRGVDAASHTGLRLAAADGPLVTRIARLVTGRTHRRWVIMPAALLPLIAATFALAGFHQAHVSSGQDDKKSARTPAKLHSDGASPGLSAGTSSDLEGASLTWMRLPEYQRRPIDPSTVSRITLALTHRDEPQPLAAIERGAIVKSAVDYANNNKNNNHGVEAVVGPGARSNLMRASDGPGGPAAVAASTGSSLSVPQPTERNRIAANRAGHEFNSSDQSSAYGLQGVDAAAVPDAIKAGLSVRQPFGTGPIVTGITGNHTATKSIDTRALPAGANEVTESGGELIHRVTPRYPMRARSRGLVDKVVVSIDVDASGKVDRVSVINHDSRAMFQRAVVRAVSQWEFEPLLRNGVPVERTVEQSFNFKLEPFTAKRRSPSCRGAKGEGCQLST